MGDPIVSSVINLVMERSTSLAAQDFAVLWGLKSDLRSLRTIFIQIQSVLADAEVKQRTNRDLQDWLRKLRAASFEVENVLEEVSTEALLRRLHVERGIKNNVSTFFSASNPLKFRVRMVQRVREMKESLDAIAAEIIKFELEEGVANLEGVTDIETSATRAIKSIDCEIVGREYEKEMIVGKICSNFDVSGHLNMNVMMDVLCFITSEFRVAYPETRTKFPCCNSAETGVKVMFLRSGKAVAISAVDISRGSVWANPGAAGWQEATQKSRETMTTTQSNSPEGRGSNPDFCCFPIGSHCCLIRLFIIHEAYEECDETTSKGPVTNLMVKDAVVHVHQRLVVDGENMIPMKFTDLATESPGLQQESFFRSEQRVYEVGQPTIEWHIAWCNHPLKKATQKTCN
ncbi:hypothetical protein E3N88_12377 [Mikania micrantha]|uniref:Disease resistance N-terminal domain-containing protein n=1 Tax=Mikania micrantha TaxID=192012 RepID=A0A5N6P6N1_9ASTR|nr:hypothetical protein E3N88_12328 [Mikania micrantha]KAD5960905.1 hypothetical protein E3N88_12377 [Mikania micrantha]